MIKASGMRSGGSSRRKVHKPVRRAAARPRAAQGNWNLFGLVHGGKEGKQWQTAKNLVTTAQTHIQTEVSKFKQMYIAAILKKGKLSSDDKLRLISQIRAMTFR
jgi:hypothetical protein